MAGTGDMTAHHDAQERLTVEEAEGGGLLAASHVHRYEVAAAALAGDRVLDLCCGTGFGSRRLAATAASVLGVDVSEEAIAAARESLEEAMQARVSFAPADALTFLRACPPERFDAVVCFEGIEHVPDPEALVAELARLAEAGVRVLVSLPNSKGFEEENDFHVTDFGYEEMQTLIASLPEPVLLEQRLSEASLILESGSDADEVAGRLDPRREGPEWANHWLVAVGIPREALQRATARLAFVVAPQASGYLRMLEQANAKLLQQNARLSQTWLGLHDAAAAAVLRRLEDQTAEAIKWKAIADNNDFAREGLQRRLESPGHRMVERVRGTMLRLPGVSRAMRLRGKLSGR
jgi:2-polyprenyl-3-methyl-5-hydroxy-6-metoxy-1,4-benzoquinol methylase